MIQATVLSNRGYLIVQGEDRVSFLQGLLTNDVSKVTKHQSIYTLLLTPQGRYIHDLIISQVGEELVVECDRDRLESLVNRLQMYVLRSKVTITLDQDHCVVALWSTFSSEGQDVVDALELSPDVGSTKTTSLWTAMMDPRLITLGARLRVRRDGVERLSECLGVKLIDEEEYRYHRLLQGVPESANELIVDKSIPLECGMDELNAIDWHKGCYVGQELTARTRYRGLVRKRLVPLILPGPVNLDEPIMSAEAEVGTWYTVCRDRGLALVRLEAMNDTLMSGEVRVLPYVPTWMQLGESE